MRLLFPLPLLFLILLFVALGGAGTQAQDMPKAAIATLDYARILQASDAAKDIRRQVKLYQDGFRKEFQTAEHRLRETEAELKRQRKTASPEAFEKKRQKFKSQVVAVQRWGQDYKRQLDRAAKMAVAKVQRAFIPIVKKLAGERGFNIVVDDSKVLFADRRIDVTDEVMVLLNQEIRTTAVSKPQ